MKSFEPVKLKLAQCQAELSDFAALLSKKPDLDEHGDILPFFKSRKMLSALIGTLVPDISDFVVAHEFPLMGSFTCDLIVGDHHERSFVFVEFENADANSLFRKRGRYLPEWGARLEHAFGQVVDWLYLIDDIIIAGRSGYLDSAMENRLRWRLDNVIVNSQRVLCLTFDQLHKRLAQKLALLSIT